MFPQEFLIETQRLVADFLENQPNSAYEDIVENVSEPQELAETFLTTLSASEVLMYQQKKRKTKHFTIGLTAVMLVALYCMIIYIMLARLSTTIGGETTIITKG